MAPGNLAQAALVRSLATRGEAAWYDLGIALEKQDFISSQEYKRRWAEDGREIVALAITRRRNRLFS